MKDLKIGDEVYYTWEDLNTGEDLIYKGTIVDIIKKPIKINDIELNHTFYMLDDGMGVQRNCCYTIEELFELKNRLEFLKNTVDIKELLKEE